MKTKNESKGKTNTVGRYANISYSPSYQSLYDSYRVSFYNNKAQNFDTLEGLDSEDIVSFSTDMNIKLEADNIYYDYNDDGSVNYDTSLYYGYYCFPNFITDWMPTEQPKHGSLYVTNNPQLPLCNLKTGEGYPGYASAIFKINFNELEKKHVRKTQKVYGTIICNQKTNTPITYNFTMTYPKTIPQR